MTNVLNTSKFNIALTGAAKAFADTGDKVAAIMKAVTAQRTVAIQKAIDAGKACGLGKPAILAGIKSEVLFAAHAAGFISKSSMSNYGTSVSRALKFDIPFRADLFTDPAYAGDKKGQGAANTGKGKADAEAKAPSKSSTITRATLDGQIKAVLASARALGLSEFSADLVDLCLESLDGWKE